jgi:hypothetical protein
MVPITPNASYLVEEEVGDVGGDDDGVDDADAEAERGDHRRHQAWRRCWPAR